jgi:hypothetical protein
VLLTGPDGRTQEVAPSRGFSSGEQNRLAVTPNQSGYLYLLAVAPGGDVQLLSPRDGQSASVRGRQTVVFPQGGRSLRFTGATGREQIWVVLSRTPLRQVPLGSAGMFDLSSGQFAAVATPAASAVGGVTVSRDLALEEDAGAVYAALPAPGAAHSVALQLALEHQRSDRH